MTERVITSESKPRRLQGEEKAGSGKFSYFDLAAGTLSLFGE
jgi:hypothetical protein